MFSRHGTISTARSLSRESRRAFTVTTPAYLPRTRSNSVKTSKPRSAEDSKTPEPQTAEDTTKWIPEKAPGPPPILSLFEQQARLEQSLKKRVSYAKGVSATAAKALIQSSNEHNDLQSFLAFAKQKGLSSETAVYKGTLYEYTVMEALKQFGFHLHRTGKSNDKGIDLLGVWRLPGKPYEIKVLVQCKLSRGMPATIRELEGGYSGAPSEWQGDSVLALLATSKCLTKGVLEGIQRSQSSLGALHIEPNGLPRQFVWNSVAGERGLAGVGVTAKYEEAPSNGDTTPVGIKKTIKTVALTWKGQPFIAKLTAN
ncbi:hypothetical protein MBLNU13_g04250t1 [Cladosporium sp. NU13]